VAEWAGRHYIFSIISSVVLSAIMVFSAFQLEWDYDYRNMEPEGLTSIALLDTVMDKFDLSMDYALVVADDMEESRTLAEQYRDLPTVAITDDISRFLPSQVEQARRKPQVDDLRQQMATASVRRNLSEEELATLQGELERLEMNIIEMQDMAFLGGQDKVDEKCNMIVGDPDQPESGNLIAGLVGSFQNDRRAVAARLGQFQRSFAPHYQQAVVQMATTKPFALSDLPTWILDRYANKNHDQFLITVYPSGSIYDGEFLNRFTADVERISEKGTGLGPLMVAMLDIFGRDGRRAIMLTMVIVLILLMIDFKQPRIALMAFVPLLMGFFWMLGLMYLTEIPLNMMTVMGLPLIIGIGIDDGVHIIHRWVAEGKGQIRTVFASTGKAIFLTSLTTMFAFGSLMGSAFRAYGQFGASLLLGVLACFLTTTLILPGLIGWVERKK
ncbi:MMPL family transporter, partial [candidate division KSB1 bacterium]|nr:MMPL family transporter [candidate division KSB1 bacterium]